MNSERIINDIKFSFIANTDDIEDKIFEFFSKTPPKSDDDVHNLAKLLNIEPNILEQKIYDILASFLNAGRYKTYKGPAFDLEQIKMGIKVEMEHTTNPKISERIAKDHLTELPDYYSRLSRMEQGD